MNKNKQLLIQFYTAFQQLDFETMSSCYHDDAQFSDPVFKLNSKKEIAAMWKMLCSNAKGFELNFSDVNAEKYDGSAYWEASYQFSSTKRRVFNKIESKFYFMDGKIIEHADSFSFWRWSQMALGISGYVLGWSPFLRKKVQGEARKNLNAFISADSQS